MLAGIRKAGWPQYTLGLTRTAIKVATELGVLEQLHVLPYTGALRPEQVAELRSVPQVILLGDEAMTMGHSAEETGGSAEDRARTS